MANRLSGHRLIFPLVSLLLATQWVAAAPRPEAGTAPPAAAHVAPPTPEERHTILRGTDKSRQERLTQAAQQALLSSTAPVDVERYTIDLEVKPQQKRLDGSVRIRARVRQLPVATLDVGLYDVFTVGSILRGAASLAYTRAANMLHMALNSMPKSRMNTGFAA